VSGGRARRVPALAPPADQPGDGHQTPAGNVKIVGLLIRVCGRLSQARPDAGRDTEDGEHADVADLGRLSMAAWCPAGPAYGLPAAPCSSPPDAARSALESARAGQPVRPDLGDPPRHKASQITTANALVLLTRCSVRPMRQAISSADCGNPYRRSRPLLRAGAGRIGLSESSHSTAVRPPKSSRSRPPGAPAPGPRV
jgi:hypothetical protein